MAVWATWDRLSALGCQCNPKPCALIAPCDAFDDGKQRVFNQGREPPRQNLGDRHAVSRKSDSFWRSGLRGEDGQEHPVPRGVNTLKLSDGRYRLTGPAGDYLIVAPEGIGADVYIEQKKKDGTLHLTEGEWP